jgi:hypothetical protein
LAGLGLALGCLVAQARGQEVRWRPAAARPAAAPAALGRPEAVPGEDAAAGDAPVRPVVFRLDVPPAPHLVVPAAAQEVQKPMPSGPPALPGEPEPLPKPKSAAPAVPPGAGGATDYWGGGMAPWGQPGPVLGDGGVVHDGPAPPPGADGGGDYGGPNCCPTDCCPACPCDGCGTSRCPLPGRVWGSAEYLLYRIRNPNVPPLVTTTGNLTGAELLALRTANPAFNPGALGQPGTSVLVGGSVDMGDFNGGRFTLGFAPWDQLGFEASYMFLGSNNVAQSFSSPGFPGLYRPFFNVVTGAQDAQFVAFPGVVSGVVNVTNRASLWGADANVRYPLLCGCAYKLDVLAGFKFLDFNESLQVDEIVTFLVADPTKGVKAGDMIRVTDRFATTNHFYGGQLGADFESRRNRWVFGAMVKVGLGTMHEVVNINGTTSFLPFGGTVTTTSGGLLAQGTNSGHFSQDRFAVVPDVNLKIGYQVNDHLQVFVGYNFLYVSDVVRAADQVDLNLNPTQLPTINGGAGKLTGPARPLVPFRTTDFWAHGVNVGLQYVW